MAERRFIVQLDLERIRASLSHADGCDYSLEHVHNWLREAGFRPVEGGWLVREADLGQVEPEEVTGIEEGAPPAGD